MQDKNKVKRIEELLDELLQYDYFSYYQNKIRQLRDLIMMSVDDSKKINTLYENIDYIIAGTEEGWLDMKKRQNQKIVELCKTIKILSEYSYNELFKFKEKGKMIKLR